MSDGLVLSGSGTSSSGSLPELASVYWRPRIDHRALVRRGRVWTGATAAHTAPFIIAAVLLGMLKPVTIPVSLILLAHAWIIPELHAARGGNVVLGQAAGDPDPERVARGLLCDLLNHGPRELLAATGLVLERGRFGVWLLGEQGALLVRPGGRRVFCYCVTATGQGLPASDRIAHLLLALRADESGFATIANLAFSGSCWRLRRRVPDSCKRALDEARRLAKGASEN
jgi:hypothetical protein